jgi:hypothetical protein
VVITALQVVSKDTSVTITIHPSAGLSVPPIGVKSGDSFQVQMISSTDQCRMAFRTVLFTPESYVILPTLTSIVYKPTVPNDGTALSLSLRIQLPVELQKGDLIAVRMTSFGYNFLTSYQVFMYSYILFIIEHTC